MRFNKKRALDIMEINNVDAIVTNRKKSIAYLTGLSLSHDVFQQCTALPSLFVMYPYSRELEPFIVMRPYSIACYASTTNYIEKIITYGENPYDVKLEDVLGLNDLTAEEIIVGKVLRNNIRGKSIGEALIGQLKENGLGSGTIACDIDSETPYYDLIKEGLPSGKVLRGERLIKMIRAIKTEEEIDIQKIATRINESGFEAILNSAKVGVSEKELAESYRTAVEKMGGEVHFINLGAGKRSALVNGTVGNYKLKNGDLIKADLDCIYNDYFSDIGRTISLGKPGNLFLKYYNGCKAGLDKMHKMMKPGVKVADVYIVTIETVRRNGIENYRMINLGHNIGTSCYDGININPRDDSIIEEGMIFNIEPSYYELGLGGIHLEDTVYITNTGCESMQTQEHKIYIVK